MACMATPSAEKNTDSDIMNVHGGSTSQSLELRKAVDVETVGDKLFSSVSLSKPQQYRGVYGGLVMSQALMAATKSVSALHNDFLLHSFHCYFVCPTQVRPPVIYKVGHAKDGRNFCSLAVKATQGDKVNFHCMASFYKPETSVVSYSGRPMPKVPKPGAPDPSSPFKLIEVSEQYPAVRLTGLSMDMVVCADVNMRKKLMSGEGVKPWNAIWIRGKDTFSAEDPQNYHRIAMVYASDLMLARLILYKYPRLKIELVTSLDHSVWFHHPVQADQWYLYVAEVERAADGRSLTWCRIYAEDGTMVATCTQESLIRPKL